MAVLLEIHSRISHGLRWARLGLGREMELDREVRFDRFRLLSKVYRGLIGIGWASKTGRRNSRSRIS